MNHRLSVNQFDDGRVACHLLQRQMQRGVETVHADHHQLKRVHQRKGFGHGGGLVEQVLPSPSPDNC
jgi:hypothetical protein